MTPNPPEQAQRIGKVSGLAPLFSNLLPPSIHIPQRPSLAPGGLNPAEFGPSLSAFGPESVEIGPKLAEPGLRSKLP